MHSGFNLQLSHSRRKSKLTKKLCPLHLSYVYFIHTKEQELPYESDKNLIKKIEDMRGEPSDDAVIHLQNGLHWRGP